MSKPKLVVDKIETDLEWRGPGGKPMAHIVLPREQAELLLQEFYDLLRRAGERYIR